MNAKSSLGSDIGLVGLAVMGQNLALNIADMAITSLFLTATLSAPTTSSNIVKLVNSQRRA